MENNLEISEWSSNDQFWKSFYKYMFCLDLTPKATVGYYFDLVDHPFGHQGEVQSILTYLQNNKKFLQYSDLKILDLCCGPGRHCVQFSRYGCKEVTGVDKSPFLLNFGKQYVNESENHTNIEWIEEDMRNFCRENNYDIIVNLYSSFGYFENFDENYLVLLNVYSSLVEGGVFILETTSKSSYLMREKYGHLDSKVKLSDGTSVTRKRKLVNDNKCIECEWILTTTIDTDNESINKNEMKDENNVSFKTNCNIYSAEDFEFMFHMAGFKNISFFGSWLFEPYDDKDHLIVVGYK